MSNSFCNPMDCSPPGSSVGEISQARKLEWVAVSFSGDLPDAGVKPVLPAFQADSLSLSHLGSQSIRVYNTFTFNLVWN